MAIVERAGGAIDGRFEIDDAAVAAAHQRAAGLVDRAIAHDQQIGGEQGLVGAHDGAEIGGAGLFLALPQDLDVDVGFDALGGQRIERPQRDGDGGFVVPGGAAVQAPFHVDGGGAGQIDLGAGRRCGAQGGLERRIEPAGLVYRLPVIMGIEQEGALGAGGAALRKHTRGCAGAGAKLACGEAARFQLGFEEIGVAIHVGQVAGDARHGDESAIIGDQLALIGFTPVADGGAQLVRGRAGKRRRRHQRQQRPSEQSPTFHRNSPLFPDWRREKRFATAHRFTYITHLL